MNTFTGLINTMQRCATVFMLAIALFFTPSGAWSSDKPWQLEKEDQNTQIYSREVQGSPFLSVKAVSLIDASLEAVIAQMGDGNGCTAWRSMCKSSRVLEQVSDEERLVYVVLDLPWPVSDRDMVVHSKATADKAKKKVSVSFETVSDRYPVQDLVRAESNASYIIKVVGDNQIEFTYIMHTDLGGKIPAGKFNSRLLDSTLKDMQHLLDLIQS